MLRQSTVGDLSLSLFDKSTCSRFGANQKWCRQIRLQHLTLKRKELMTGAPLQLGYQQSMRKHRIALADKITSTELLARFPELHEIVTAGVAVDSPMHLKR